MDAYEKLIMTMRQEAKKGVSKSSYGLAVMTGEASVSYNGLELDEEDVIIADHLKQKRLTDLDFDIESQTYIDEYNHYHRWIDKSKFILPLKAGDIVFGIMIETDDDDKKFLIICRI